MANGKKVGTIETDESYTPEIKRAEDEMVENARGMQRSSGFWNRAFAPEMYEGYQRGMQAAAERGNRLRRERQTVYDLRDALSGAMSESARPAARRKRTAKRK